MPAGFSMKFTYLFVLSNAIENLKFHILIEASVCSCQSYCRVYREKITCAVKKQLDFLSTMSPPKTRIQRLILVQPIVHSFIHLSMSRKWSKWIKAKKISNLFKELKPHLKIIKVAKILSQETTLFTFAPTIFFSVLQANQRQRGHLALQHWVLGYQLAQQQLQEAMAKLKP